MPEPVTHKITGNMTFETAPALLEQSQGWLNDNNSEVAIDLADAGRTDSAGIALMLEWIELARNRGLKLHFINLPHQTTEFIEVNGLENLFREFMG